MAITIDGNSLVFTGTVTVTNVTDPTTGVCTLILTPSGGVGSLPALVAGEPGPPALFSLGTVTTLASGASATVDVNQTSAGSSGVSSAYTLDFGIPQGEAGANGSSGPLADASDLSGTAAAGDTVVVSSTGPTAFEYMPFPWGKVYSAQSISNVSKTGTASGTLTSISVPPLSYDYYPICFAQSTISGTVNTAVDLKALLNDASTGNVLGDRNGVTGAASQTLTMIPSFGALLTGSYGKVSSGSAAVMYLVAQGTANTTDSWSTSNSKFTVVAFPVAS